MTSAGLSLTDRPVLRRGVRTGIDPLGGEPILLFPEGVLFLNHTAAAVIGRCDGSRSVAEVIHALSQEYDNIAVEDVVAMLEELIAQHLVACRG